MRLDGFVQDFLPAAEDEASKEVPNLFHIVFSIAVNAQFAMGAAHIRLD